MRKLFCFLACLLSLAFNCTAVVEFVCTINRTGEDYNDLTTWENAMDDSASFASGARASNWVTKTGSLSADGTAIDWATGATGTGTLIHITESNGSSAGDQYFIEVLTGTLADGDIILDVATSTDGFTISGTPETIICVAELYDDQGDLDDKNIVISGGGEGFSNYWKITAPVGERHDGTPGTGARISSSFTSSGYMFRLIDDYIQVEWLELNPVAGDGTTDNVYTISSTTETARRGMKLNNCLIYPTDITSGNTGWTGIRYHGSNHSSGTDSYRHRIYNCIISDFLYGKGVHLVGGSFRPCNVVMRNTTITNCDNGFVGTINSNAFYIGALFDSENNLITNCTTYNWMEDFNAYIYNGSVENNLSDDGFCGFTVQADTGTADTDTLNHIIQSGQNFETTVIVGYMIHNTTDDIWGYVTTINSDTDLTVDIDVCPDGNEAFIIYDAFVNRTITLDSNYHLIAGDTDAIDMGEDTGTDAYGKEIDITGTDRDADALVWDIGAKEFVGGAPPAGPLLGAIMVVS